MRIRERATFTLVGLGLLAQGCGNSTEATRAAVGTGAVVAASGINRAVTKDCWARCSAGYLCNQRTGLCEPGECLPACPPGYSCTVTPTETRCVAHGRLLFDPVTEQTRVDRYGPRGSMGAPGQNQDYQSLQRNAARNDVGQVALPRRESSLSAPQTDPHESGKDGRVAGGSEELRMAGARIFDDLESLVVEWRHRQSTAPALELPPRRENLGHAEPTWESYAESIHRRLHSVYSDGFLQRLKEVSATHALQQESLRASVSLVIDATTGRVIRVSLLGSSDSELFDVAALESVRRTSPFPPPPQELVSNDQKVYLSWELHRDIDYACSAAFLRLHLKKASNTLGSSD